MDTTNDQNSSPAAPAASAPAIENDSSASPTPGSPAEAPQDPALQKPDPEQRARTVTQRISQLTARYHDEQRAREAAETRLAQYERQQAISQQFSQLDAQAPQIDKFDSLHQYQMAMANWTTQRAAMVAQAQWDERQQAERATQAQQYAQMAQQQQRVAAENAVIEQKMAKGVQKYPDFMEAVGNPELPSLRGTPLMTILLETENGVDIGYALAKNPSEYERILELSVRNPAAAAREVFRMDAKFAGNGPTNAPPPPPQRNGSTQVVKDYSGMSTAEHVKAYREAKRKRA